MRRGFLATLIFGLFGLGILLSLGVWQIDRLGEKETELARINAYISEAPVALADDTSPKSDEYRPVVVAGEMLAGELHVLVSTRDYGAGFRIIAPFVTDAGRRIMIDRGYVRVGSKDETRSVGSMEVTGNLHWPDERDKYIPEDDVDANYWYARDVNKMAAALGTDPVLIVARTGTDPHILPLPVSTEAIPNNHLSYAIQWFLFAAVWFGMTSALLWRIRTTTD